MHLGKQISCTRFPCLDVEHKGYMIPDVEIFPEGISMVVISEAAPADRKDYYYMGGDSAFERTSLEVFKEAGSEVSSFNELQALGIYFTSAVKCSKIGYGIKAGTIKECSRILDREIALLPNIKVILLMGDVAIKAINYIARRAREDRVIPAGSTYKLRGKEYCFRGIKAFPSYLQVGPSFGIEKSKRRMIVEDIKSALAIVS